MAKTLTAKIRIGDYSASTNSFEIKFQLRPASDGGPDFIFIFSDRMLSIPDDTLFWLTGLGLTAEHINQAFDEVLEWLQKPRATLGGSTWDQIMWRRIELAMQISRTDETVNEHRRAEAAVRRIMMDAPTMDFALEALDTLEADHDVSTNCGDFALYASGIRVPGYFEKKIERIVADEELAKQGHPVLAIKATEDRLAAIQAAGMGDAPPKVEVPEGWEVAPSDERHEARYQARRRRAEDATDKAVNVIHSHARRFVTPMSLREHDFLRSIIQEEIEKVVRPYL